MIALKIGCVAGEEKKDRPRQYLTCHFVVYEKVKSMA
jgi:hypothetical protein